MKRHLSSLLCLSISLLLSACGSRSDSDDNGGQTYTDVFMDAAVEGLQYQTETHMGLTNARGEFLYELGEKVTFSIGAIALPSISAQSQLSPLDIFNTDDYEHLGVINLSRLLQTLDIDGQAENGITLASNIHDLAANITLDFTSESFDTDIELLVNENVSINHAINTQLVSATVAIAHFQSTLSALDYNL